MKWAGKGFAGSAVVLMIAVGCGGDDGVLTEIQRDQITSETDCRALEIGIVDDLQDAEEADERYPDGKGPGGRGTTEEFKARALARAKLAEKQMKDINCP